jgi:uncharacterized protein YidB (DUF937 family)
MGFLDEMAGKVMGSVLGSSDSPLAAHALQMLNDHPGGLQGLVDCFHQQGLGGVVSSWVGNGENQPITAEQITSVLGQERVAALASKIGMSPEDASAKLAEFLPGMIDKLTPNGQVNA